MKRAVFIFRRDLRLFDNTALIKASKESDQVIPIFIFDPNQISSNNQYFSNNAFEFMVNSIESLDKELKSYGPKLHIFYGNYNSVIDNILKSNKVDKIYVNEDYTPFSINRDNQIKEICQKNNCGFESLHDLTLVSPKELNKTYRLYGMFYKMVSKIKVREIDNYQVRNFGTINCEEFDYKKLIKKVNKELAVKGTRKEGLELIQNIKNLDNYNNLRDYPEANSTSKLSAHIKFGTVSVREVYYEMLKNFGLDSQIIKELYWRDFFTLVALNNPQIFGNSFVKKYDKIKWSDNINNFNKWKEGKTGFPIVDAGIRELNQTGFMHNRVRMITASFLVKDLHIDWREGEKYFAQKLVDYDPCVNNGNWQYIASTGCDSAPYFRIFNPFVQQQKFDKDCKYIKHWVKELQNMPNEVIHNWDKEYINYTNISYPKPIVNHKIESEIAKEIFRELNDKKV